MQTPVEICFRGMHETADLRREIKQRVAALESLCDRIVSCRVTINARSGDRDGDRLHRVRVYVALAGKEIAVKSSPDTGYQSGDVRTCVRKAFDDLYQHLNDYAPATLTVSDRSIRTPHRIAV